MVDAIRMVASHLPRSKAQSQITPQRLGLTDTSQASLAFGGEPGL